jgi:hypothetical protein
LEIFDDSAAITLASGRLALSSRDSEFRRDPVLSSFFCVRRCLAFELSIERLRNFAE